MNHRKEILWSLWVEAQGSGLMFRLIGFSARVLGLSLGSLLLKNRIERPSGLLPRFLEGFHKGTMRIP